jgi:ribosomal protein S18 acetylase RimI-like enzyme
MSLETDEIPWEVHCAWFAGRLASADTLMLIGEAGGRRIGVVRFDRIRNATKVSIVIAPERRGQGWGERLLRCGCGRAERKGFGPAFDAEIKLENLVSRLIFERAGFRLLSSGDVLHYQLRSLGLQPFH